jgi:uncharacterized membrane protein YccC
MTWPSQRSLIIASSSYLSVGLALYVAFALDLQNPWWAMLTVYITQPPQRLTGTIWSKCFYRIAGTLLGGVVCVALIPPVSNSPVLLLLGIAGWLALCVFFGLIDRTPRSYLFMLAGYTVALVGLPLASNPGIVFDVVVARAEEIIIGVVATAVVQSLVFPVSVTDLALAKLDGMISAAGAWLVQNLADPDRAPPQRELLLDLNLVNALAADWRFEGTLPVWRRRALWALEERLVALLPAITAVDDQMSALVEAGGSEAETRALAKRVATWAADAEAGGPEALAAIHQDLQAAEPRLAPDADWRTLLKASLTRRLRELTTLWSEACVLARMVRTGAAPIEPRAARMIAEARPRSLHMDSKVAARSALTAAVTVGSLGAFSILTRWELGFLSMGIAAACCALFAVADDPTPLARDFLIGFCAGLPIALIYEFAILPRLDGYPLLMASLLPVLIPGALVYAQPRHTVWGLGMLIAFSVLLAIQPSFANDLPTFLNGFLAAVVGVIAASMGLGLMRIIPTERAVSRLLQAGWREVASVLRGRAIPQRRVWASRMIDRVGLLIPRLLRLQREDEATFNQVLREPRLALAAIELKSVRSKLDVGAGTEIDFALAALADHFERLGSGAPPRPTELLTRLDGAIAQILTLDDASDRHSAAAAVLSFRRTMFPAAPAYASRRGPA